MASSVWVTSDACAHVEQARALLTTAGCALHALTGFRGSRAATLRPETTSQSDEYEIGAPGRLDGNGTHARIERPGASAPPPECVVACWDERDAISRLLASLPAEHATAAIVYLVPPVSPVAPGAGQRAERAERDERAERIAAEMPADPLVDLLLLPASPDAMSVAVLRAIRRRGSLLQRDLPRSEAAAHVADGLVGPSAALAQVIAGARQVAASPGTSVLIEGESGTGKELIARLVHRHSPGSRHRPFVDLNCAAIPADLLEAELFGYERGAFTQAAREKPGLMEMADGGTLFLDEVGELNIGLQAKLLRVLETQSFRRLGGVSTRRSECRVVASTNRDLLSSVQKGFFRLDLYHRLAVFTIHVPPLRERAEDILPLATYFLKRFADATKKRLVGFSPAAQALLLEYVFPGNVRELKNIIERAVIVEEGPVVTPRSLALDFGRLRTDVVAPGGASAPFAFAPAPLPSFHAPAGGPSVPSASPGFIAPSPLSSLSSPASVSSAMSPSGPAASAASSSSSPTLADQEHRHIEQVLRQVHGNRVQAARLLGISVPTLYAKMRKYGLEAVGRALPEV